MPRARMRSRCSSVPSCRLHYARQLPRPSRRSDDGAPTGRRLQRHISQLAARTSWTPRLSTARFISPTLVERSR